MKYKHSDFQNKMKIKAHFLNYPYPPVQFPTYTELRLRKWNRGGKFYQHWRPGTESPSRLSPNEYMQNETGKGREVLLSTHCLWRKDPEENSGHPTNKPGSQLGRLGGLQAPKALGRDLRPKFTPEQEPTEALLPNWPSEVPVQQSKARHCHGWL